MRNKLIKAATMPGLRDEAGFTLIELLVVIAIIPVGISLLLPAVQVFRDSDSFTASREALGSARVEVDSHWTIAGRLPAGTGIGDGSSLDLSLGLSNLPDDFTQRNPIEIPPCPVEPCPLFAVEGEFDRMMELDVADFADETPIQVLMEATLDLRPSSTPGLAVASDLAQAVEADELNLTWTGTARLILLYDVPTPGMLALLAFAMAGLGFGMRHRPPR